MGLFRRKTVTKTYDKKNKKPVIKASICNGEQVAGFKDIHTGKIEEVMLIKNQADLDAFKNIDMNIQIFGTKKCNDTKKAERFFKERGIKYQFIDMKEKGMSKGEFNSVAQANGGLENMVNWDGKDKDLLALIKYIADEDKLEKVLENPQVIKTPVVRNGKQSTLGYQPDIWKGWN